MNAGLPDPQNLSAELRDALPAAPLSAPEPPSRFFRRSSKGSHSSIQPRLVESFLPTNCRKQLPGVPSPAPVSPVQRRAWPVAGYQAW